MLNDYDWKDKIVVIGSIGALIVLVLIEMWGLYAG